MFETIKFSNQSNKIIDFDNLLSIGNSLYFKNCSDLQIIIKNKINKIIFENSKNIFISVNSLVSGIEISNSQFILLAINNLDKPKKSIPFIELFKSTLFLLGDIDIYKKISISCEMSNLHNVSL